MITNFWKVIKSEISLPSHRVQLISDENPLKYAPMIGFSRSRGRLVYIILQIMIRNVGQVLAINTKSIFDF